MKYDLDTFRGDLFGGLTSTVVALPVALGFGIASGMGAAAGLHGAIAVGLFASLFGGSRTQISGPTAPTTIVMAVIVTSHTTSLAEALTVVVLSGLVQILLGLSRLGRFAAYTPHVVISGFMSGIGVIIVLDQMLPALGAAPVPGEALEALAELPGALDRINPEALAIAAATLATAFLWPRRLERFAPGLLAALAVGSLLGVLWLDEAPVIGPIPAGLPHLQLPLLSPGLLLDLLKPALMLALLNSVDSLLTAMIADSMTGDRHNPDRELVGQGIANTVAGLIGALPGGGSATGTVTNIRAGGATPVSGIVRAVLLLALLLGLGGYAEPIPLAALAGVLMKVGWDILDWRLLARVHALRREHLVVMLSVLALTVFVDLITAVAVGLIAGGMVHARQLERLELDTVVSVPLLDRAFLGPGAEEAGDPFSARVGLVALGGSLTVASSHRLAAAIGPEIRDHEIVIFDFSGAGYIDDSAAMVLERLIGLAEDSGTSCIVAGLEGAAARTLDSLRCLASLPEGRIVDTRDDARRLAGRMLREDGADSA